jgi:hypothetical protein
MERPRIQHKRVEMKYGNLAKRTEHHHDPERLNITDDTAVKEWKQD